MPSSQVDRSGPKNPNWKGGMISKTCEVCGISYQARRAQAASRFCSLQCVGVSQRGRKLKPSTKVKKACERCGSNYMVYRAHVDRTRFCSKPCAFSWRAEAFSGEKNHNWSGGISRLPYPWNFRHISKRIIDRDGGQCQNPNCAGTDKRMTAHHINYDKKDCRDENLIALCSACNSKANFNRPRWQVFYTRIIAVKKVEKAWKIEVFE